MSESTDWYLNKKMRVAESEFRYFVVYDRMRVHRHTIKRVRVMVEDEISITASTGQVMQKKFRGSELDSICKTPLEARDNCTLFYREMLSAAESDEEQAFWRRDIRDTQRLDPDKYTDLDEVVLVFPEVKSDV